MPTNKTTTKTKLYLNQELIINITLISYETPWYYGHHDITDTLLLKTLLAITEYNRYFDELDCANNGLTDEEEDELLDDKMSQLGLTESDVNTYVYQANWQMHYLETGATASVSPKFDANGVAWR